MRMKLFTFIFLSFYFSSAWSQKTITKELYNEAKNKYSLPFYSKNFQLNFTQRIYLNPDDKIPYSESKGEFIRGEKMEYRTNSQGILTIQNEHVKMVIDSSSKLVLLFKPDSLFQPILNENGTSSLSTYSEKVNGSTKAYKINYSNEISNYESLEYQVNTKTGLITKLEIQLVEANFNSESLDDETLEHPLLVIDYEPMLKLKYEPSRFSIAAYITLQDQKYTLTSKLAGYSLDDLRYRSE